MFFKNIFFLNEMTVSDDYIVAISNFERINAKILFRKGV